MVVDKETALYVNSLFDLHATGSEQDWSIELSDRTRVMEFIDTFKSNDFPSNVQNAVLELIIASYDDYLSFGIDDSQLIWREIETLISKNKNLCSEMLEYWALRNEKEEANLFNITPLIRSLVM